MDRLTASRALACTIAVFSVMPAVAAPRTFVSTAGVDNPSCSIASPCRTFGAAIAATSPGGEVIVLNSGGYGPVVISQAVSIAAPPGVYAGVSVSSGDGITINTGISDVVTLSGLAINSTGGTNGIHITSAGRVNLERLQITNFSTGGAAGILDDAVNTDRVTVKHMTIRNVDTGVKVVASTLKYVDADDVAISDAAAAIVAQGPIMASLHAMSVSRITPGTAIQFLLPMSAFISVALDHVDLSDVAGGVLIQTVASSGIALDVTDSSFIRCAGRAIQLDGLGGGANQVTVTRSRFGYLSNRAVDATGTMRVGLIDVTIENAIGNPLISIDGGGTPSDLQMSNTRIHDFASTAIYVHGSMGPITALLHDNVISRGGKGVVADSGATVRLSGNSITDLTSTALTLQGIGSAMTSLGNNFIDGTVGVEAVPTLITGK